MERPWRPKPWFGGSIPPEGSRYGRRVCRAHGWPTPSKMGFNSSVAYQPDHAALLLGGTWSFKPGQRGSIPLRGTCQRSYAAEHYKHNAPAYKARAKRDKVKEAQKTKDLIASLKLCCTRCGLSHPAVLDFHHTDPKTKEANIALLRSRKAIAKEAEKCIVLCSNCHRILHWEERTADLAQSVEASDSRSDQ